MVVGFNHNFRYKDTVYHVQTEDGGVKFPFIITHLFIGGTILQTKKTSYADIIKADRLEQVVEELMKDQHRDMLRRLRNGAFDEIIAKYPKSSEAGKGEDASVTKEDAAPVAPARTDSPPVAAPVLQERPTIPVATPAAPSSREPSLDDIILSYLLGESGR